MTGERFCTWCESAAKRAAGGWFGSYANVRGELVHYVEQGAGRPLILLHGFMAWSYTWRHNLPALAQHAHVFAPDLRGFGLTEKGNRRGHSLTDQVELVRNFMDELGIRQAVLCGHSMGGEISLRFALTYPERVAGLILESASGYILPPKKKPGGHLLAVPGLGHLLIRLAIMNRRFADSTLRAAYFRPERVTPAEVAAFLLPSTAPGASAAFLGMLRDMDFGKYAHKFREITHPSLLVWGENDPWVPLRFGQQLAGELSQSRLVVLPECKHLAHEEYPDAFNRLAIEFLTTIAPTDR